MVMRYAVLVVVVALSACASYDGRGLQPGIATDADVRQLMGPPAAEYASPDGSKELAYPKGPMGVETYMVHLRPDGRLARIDQVLDADHFARIVTGKTTREEVRRLLGPPGSTMEFPRMQRLAWTYRFRDVWGYDADFSTVFDVNGIVVEKVIVRLERGMDSN